MVICSAFLCALRGYFFLLYIKYNFMCSSKSDRREDFLARKYRITVGRPINIPE